MPAEPKKKTRKSRSRVFTDGTYVKPVESEILIKEASIVEGSEANAQPAAVD